MNRGRVSAFALQICYGARARDQSTALNDNPGRVFFFYGFT